MGPSAAATSSLLASLATGQCGVGGRVLRSNLNTVSLNGDSENENNITTNVHNIWNDYPWGNEKKKKKNTKASVWKIVGKTAASKRGR